MASEASNLVLLYVTAQDVAEATRMGRTLVQERLAACANVLPGMTSVYEWQGELCESAEAVLVLKTRASLAGAAAERVRALHSYDVPCVVTLPIVGGNGEFLQWVVRQTNEAGLG